MNKTALLCFPLLLSAAPAARAAVITYGGVVEDATVPEWRTASTLKPMDADGDNIYGTHGAAAWGTFPGHNEQFAAGSTSPGWRYLGETSFGQFSNAGYVQVDDLANPGSNRPAGIAAVQSPGAFTFELTGLPATYAGRTVRVGIMQDVLDISEAAADNGKTLQLVQVTGGAAISPVISVRGGAAGNHLAEMYFFDIAGVNPFDQFRIVTGGGPQQVGYVGYVTWDLSPVPEPGAVSLGALAGLFMLRRRR